MSRLIKISRQNRWGTHRGAIGERRIYSIISILALVSILQNWCTPTASSRRSHWCIELWASNNTGKLILWLVHLLSFNLLLQFFNSISHIQPFPLSLSWRNQILSHLFLVTPPFSRFNFIRFGFRTINHILILCFCSSSFIFVRDLLMEASESCGVKVALHIRPLIGDERVQGCKECVAVTPGLPQVCCILIISIWGFGDSVLTNSVDLFVVVEFVGIIVWILIHYHLLYSIWRLHYWKL